MKKLYYQDSHLRTFTATVTGCVQVKKGWEITLNATAFYPEGGGQASDTGILGEAKVLSVREEGEEIFHLCDQPLEIGATVNGEIDWERRFDLMQQHAGEHIVSGIIHKLYGWHNVGFHMGSDVITIDFDGPVPLEALPEIEAAANAAIWQDLPIKCWYPSKEELPTVPYRRKKDLPWPVRIVEFPGYDICACCGTHPKTTGAIGLVKLFSCVKFHEGVRMEMACGKRALTMLNAAYEQNKQVSQAFSAKIGETGLAAQRMNEALAAEKFRANTLEKQLFTQIAQGYAGKNLALHFAKDLTPNGCRELCDAIADFAKIAVTLSGTDESGYCLCVLSRTEDAKSLGDAAAKALNGRGGGKKEAFQGRISATRGQIENFFTHNENL